MQKKTLFKVQGTPKTLFRNLNFFEEIFLGQLQLQFYNNSQSNSPFLSEALEKTCKYKQEEMKFDDCTIKKKKNSKYENIFLV